MEIKQIKELMAAMERWGTTKVQIKKGSFEINLERAPVSLLPSRPSFRDEGEEWSQRFMHQKSVPPASEMTAVLQSEEKNLPGKHITSPMVGTFYPAPSPDAPPFVKVGDFVEEGQIVCIIEAMKVMNEIKSKVSGTVVEVLVQAGHPVEFGTKIFRIQ